MAGFIRTSITPPHHGWHFSKTADNIFHLSNLCAKFHFTPPIPIGNFPIVRPFAPRRIIIVDLGPTDC